MNVLERLLKYVSYDTQSKEGMADSPSTAKQFDLALDLKKELEDLGFDKVLLDDKCYLYGRLKATEGMGSKKAVGFISHIDTAPDFSGCGVNPQIIENYDGNDVLLKGTGELLKVSDFPDLINHRGKTLVTTDGNTLLGADDKAGIAEIITAMEEIKQKNIPHGDIWVAFTPDEEVGLGAAEFDLDYFKADFAYTVDGDYEGEIAYENFNAASAKVEVRGKNVHPGSAKDIMVNAASILSEIQDKMPKEQVPEKTKDREGFIMLCELKGNVAYGEAEYIIRDHDMIEFDKKKDLVSKIIEEINLKYGKEVARVLIEDTYFNMAKEMTKHMDVVELAVNGIKSLGLEVCSKPIRGGTDGATITNNGLPCPNLGTGGYAFHGPYEHITKEGMENTVKIIEYIATNVK
jgi:tripeptide aminopeptidase